MDEALGRRLDAIEKRLAALEARANGLNLTPVPPADALSAASVANAVASPAEPTFAPAAVAPMSAPAVRPPPLPKQVSPEQQAASDRYAANMRAAFDGVPPEIADAREPGPSAQPAAAQPAFARVARPAHQGFELEQLLGLKFAGWIGAVVLLIGAALGVKFAYDQGWLGQVPDLVRCAAITASGLVLIAAGEVVYRRINPISSAGPFGAGVGLLFLSAYAGQAWYGLYSPGMAFALMAMAALLGMIVAARADLVSVAAIALLGSGLFAPASLDVFKNPHGFLVYLLSLQVLALGLCTWRAAPKWWVLRALSLFVTTGWFLGVLGGMRAPIGNWSVLLMAAVSVVLFQGELLFSTRRHVRQGWGEPMRGLTFSFLATLAFAAELMIILRDLSAETRGNVLFALVPLAFVLARFCDRQNLKSLASGFDVQAVILLGIAIPIRLSGPSVLLSWIAVAGGLAVIGLVNRNRTATVLGVAVWVFSAIAVVFWTSDQNSSRNIWLTLGTQPIIAGLVIAAIATIVGHAVSQGLRRAFNGAPVRDGVNNVDLPILIDLAAALCFMVVLLPSVAADFGTRVGLGYAVLLWLAATASPLAALSAVSTAALVFVAFKWAGYDVIGRHARGIYSGPWPILNAETLNGLAIAVFIAGVTKSRRFRMAGANGFLALVLLAILLIAGSAEVDRYAVLQQNGPVWIVRQVGFSIYWAALAVAALIAGFALHQRLLRMAALGLLGATLLKVVIIDLSGAGTGWRILSFLALGALLLITSVLYGRFAKKTTVATA